MNELTVVANIKAKEGMLELLKSELEKLVVFTNEEKGCIQYELHQNNKSSNDLMMFEKWESRSALDAHMKQPHFLDFRNNTKSAIAEFVVNELTQVK